MTADNTRTGPIRLAKHSTYQSTIGMGPTQAKLLPYTHIRVYYAS